MIIYDKLYDSNLEGGTAVAARAPDTVFSQSHTLIENVFYANAFLA